MDYTENYSFQWQNEMQSQHWSNFQVTILVHLIFRIQMHWDGNLDSRIVTEYHFYISDDKQLDNMFTQHCFNLHREFLQTQGQPLLVEHIVFSYRYSS